MTYTEYENKQAEINSLIAMLSSSQSDIGDWKIAKYQECILVGTKPPYDITELHVKRQTVRDKINALRYELENAVIKSEMVQEIPIKPLPESQFDVPVVEQEMDVNL